MTPAEFAQAFKAARLARGLSQSRAARLLDVTAVTVWLWENQRRMPWEPEGTLARLETAKPALPPTRNTSRNNQRLARRLRHRHS